MGPTWGHFENDFRGPTGFEHDVMWFSSSDATANGRRPRGPVNIGSKRTCVVGVLHCIGLENRFLDPCMSSFFEAFVASPIHPPFKTAFATDVCRNYRFLALNLGPKRRPTNRGFRASTWLPSIPCYTIEHIVFCCFFAFKNTKCSIV